MSKKTIQEKLKELEDNNSYVATVHCWNCDKREVITIPKGRSIGGQPCSNCGNKVSKAL